MFGTKMNHMLVGVFSVREYETAKQMCTLDMDLCRLHEMDSTPITLVQNVLESCGYDTFLDCVSTLKKHVKENYSHEVERAFNWTFQPMLFDWDMQRTNTVQYTV